MSFDRLAPHYRWMECVLAGDKLQRCRTAFLSSELHASSVLIVGEGNGRFLVECLQKLQPATVVCVDASEKMLELARRRLESVRMWPQQVEFLHENVLHWTPPARQFDLIVTHFFLDCFAPAELRTVLSRLSSAARQGAHWLIADFQVPENGVARCRARLIHWLMYRFFVVATSLGTNYWTAPDPWLIQNGFRLKKRKVTEWGLLRSDCWSKG